MEICYLRGDANPSDYISRLKQINNEIRNVQLNAVTTYDPDDTTAGEASLPSEATLKAMRPYPTDANKALFYGGISIPIWQRADPFCKVIQLLWANKEIPENLKFVEKDVKRHMDTCTARDGAIYKLVTQGDLQTWVPVLPQVLKHEILTNSHSHFLSGHFYFAV